MKQVVITAVITRTIEVPDGTEDVVYSTAGVFSGIDGAIWNIESADTEELETVE